ncbi:hypothetical protein LCGC14_1414200 [marine sediment metagenome]|uniref:Uncharacterized protein n=1 Tax=marine sediment metagenome TaxID=412755 RepID=A0A0F9JTB6_9ZZZZ
MPHMGPASEASMLDKVVAIASDPVLHKRVLGEFKERQKLAQDAEAKAREAEGKSAAAEKKSERAEKRLEAKVVAHDNAVADNAGLRRVEDKRLDDRELALDARSGELTTAEALLKNDQEVLAVQTAELAAQVEAFAPKEADLIEREAALAEQAEAIRIREGKFENRLREFNADL